MKNKQNRELLFSVTAKDCRWDYYRGTGAGGQAKNKTENCARVTHDPSGATGKAEEGRSKDLNRRTAWERMCKTDKFQNWCKSEAMRRTGEAAMINAEVDRKLLQECKVQVMNDKGEWIDAPDLSPTQWDIINSKEALRND